MKQRVVISLIVVTIMFFSSVPSILAFTAPETPPASVAVRASDYAGELWIAHFARTVANVELVESPSPVPYAPTVNFGGVGGPILMNETKTLALRANNTDIYTQNISPRTNTKQVLVLTNKGGQVQTKAINAEEHFWNADISRGQRLFYNATDHNVSITSGDETFTLGPYLTAGRTHFAGQNTLNINVAGTTLPYNPFNDYAGDRRLIVVTYGSTDDEVELLISPTNKLFTSDIAQANAQATIFHIAPETSTEAGTASVAIINQTNKTICAFYVRESGQNGWGNNWLERVADPHLYTDDKVVLTTRRPGYYDFLIISCSGDYAYKPGFDLTTTRFTTNNPDTIDLVPNSASSSGPVRIQSSSNAGNSGNNYAGQTPNLNGTIIEVTAAGEPLNVRNAVGLSGSLIDNLLWGDRALWTGAIFNVDGYTWYEVKLYSDRIAYVAYDPAWIVVRDPSQTTPNIAVGKTIRITTEGNDTHLRNNPSVINSSEVQTLYTGNTLTVIGGPTYGEYFQWWNLQLPDGRTGWAVDVPGWWQVQ